MEKSQTYCIHTVLWYFAEIKIDFKFRDEVTNKAIWWLRMVSFQWRALTMARVSSGPHKAINDCLAEFENSDSCAVILAYSARDFQNIQIYFSQNLNFRISIWILNGHQTVFGSVYGLVTTPFESVKHKSDQKTEPNQTSRPYHVHLCLHCQSKAVCSNCDGVSLQRSPESKVRKLRKSSAHLAHHRSCLSPILEPHVSSSFA